MIIIFAPWLLPLTFSWHRGIKVSEICIFQIRRCVLCLHVPWCMFSHLFHVCCPSCPNKEPRLGPIPPRASRAPPDFLTSLPPAFLLSLSPPLSSTLFSHRYLIPLLPSYICLSRSLHFSPRLVVFSFAPPPSLALAGILSMSLWSTLGVIKPSYTIRMARRSRQAPYITA